MKTDKHVYLECNVIHKSTCKLDKSMSFASSSPFAYVSLHHWFIFSYYLSLQIRTVVNLSEKQRQSESIIWQHC